MGNITTSVLNTSGTLTPREKDFVFQFEKEWSLLKAILGILREIKKEDGTTLTYYTAERVGDLKKQTGEGVATVGTEYQVKKAGTYDITLERYEKTVTAQSVLTYGPELAIAKTDEEFLSDLQYDLLDRFYGFLKLGTLTGSRPTFQSAISNAKGAVLNRATALHKKITDIVGFVGIMDLYNYLGEKEVTIQSAFGLQYVENFLNFRVLILLPDTILSGKVLATPLNNVIAYYVDPADDGLQKLGLNYTVTGETNLIGVKMTSDYKTGTGSTFAVMGLTLFAERIDLISVIDIDSSAKYDDANAIVADSAMDTKSPAKGVSDGKRKVTG